MKRSTVTLPNYMIGEDIFEKAGAVLRKYGQTAVIVGGKKAMAAAAGKLTDALTRDGISVRGQVWFGGIPRMKMWICWPKIRLSGKQT